MKSLFSLVLILVLAGVGHAQEAYYLSPITGTGTDADPFKAHKTGNPVTCTDLRPDRLVATGYMLCRGPAVPAVAGVIALPSDDSAKMNAAKRTELQALTGKAVTVDTLSGLVGEAITTHKIPLQPKDGKTSVMVGGKEIYSAPQKVSWSIPSWRDILSAVSPSEAFAAQSFTEDWNCADNASVITCDQTWSRFQGAVLGIVSNRADTTNSTSNQAARITSAFDTTDMAVGAKLAVLTLGSATTVEAGVIARKENNSTNTYYYCHARNLTTTDEYEIGYFSAGTRTVLAASSTVIPAVNDIMELRVISDKIACYVNGIEVIAPTTDATIAGATFNRAGIRMSATGTAVLQAALDDWYGLDVTSFPSARGRIAPMRFQ